MLCRWARWMSEGVRTLPWSKRKWRRPSWSLLPPPSASRARSCRTLRAVRALPPNLLAHWGELAARLEHSEAQRGASPTAPLARDAADARLWVVSESYAWRERAPEAVGAAPGAREFPGAVPAQAPRVTRSLRFSAEVPGWQSTGLYLAPGEVLVVRTGIADLWRLRVGAHTDSL